MFSLKKRNKETIVYIIIKYLFLFEWITAQFIDKCKIMCTVPILCII